MLADKFILANVIIYLFYGCKILLVIISNKSMEVSVVLYADKSENK